VPRAEGSSWSGAQRQPAPTPTRGGRRRCRRRRNARSAGRRRCGRIGLKPMPPASQPAGASCPGPPHGLATGRHGGPELTRADGVATVTLDRPAKEERHQRRHVDRAAPGPRRGWPISEPDRVLVITGPAVPSARAPTCRMRRGERHQLERCATSPTSPCACTAWAKPTIAKVRGVAAGARLQPRARVRPDRGRGEEARFSEIFAKRGPEHRLRRVLRPAPPRRACTRRRSSPSSPTSSPRRRRPISAW
jgi:hypothetical protein